MSNNKLIGGDAVPEVNGNGRMVWWLLSVVTTILILGAGAWATAITNHQSNLENRQSMIEQRLAVIEGKLDILRDHVDSIQSQNSHR